MQLPLLTLTLHLFCYLGQVIASYALGITSCLASAIMVGIYFCQRSRFDRHIDFLAAAHEAWHQVSSHLPAHRLSSAPRLLLWLFVSNFFWFLTFSMMVGAAV